MAVRVRLGYHPGLRPTPASLQAPDTGSLRSLTPSELNILAKASQTSTITTNRFQPPGSGAGTSGIPWLPMFRTRLDTESRPHARVSRERAPIVQPRKTLIIRHRTIWMNEVPHRPWRCLPHATWARKHSLSDPSYRLTYLCRRLVHLGGPDHLDGSSASPYEPGRSAAQTSDTAVLSESA